MNAYERATDEELVALAASSAKSMRESAMPLSADLYEELAVRLVHKNELYVRKNKFHIRGVSDGKSRNGEAEAGATA